ncbi:hypothetical protein DFH07DRAFT_906161 [Mycena maculata]|uniref:Cyclin N-terminal domain-containing protein n=1 Tax=Mycena maculata TaxID=230809 RepID=A0AAD7MSE9_9AGAR|nr:hypothetical protein DFH07DRAFT_906161 [Mycena maculata]
MFTSNHSSPVHPASLVDPAAHSPELIQLVEIKLTRPVIEYLVDCVSETVDHALGRASPSYSPARGRLQKFTNFATTIIDRAEVPPATVLVTLVYIARARPHLTIALEEYAFERVFLGALIAAAKYTNDSTLKNVHWALCTGVFGKRDIGRIEREFLAVLDWELGVAEADLLAHHEALMEAVSGVRIEHLAVPVPAPRAAHTHTHAAVPELEPSSPQSSAGSLSPRTPVSHALEPDVPIPMDVESSTPFKVVIEGRKHGRLHALLHAIPLPRHHHHHRVELAT